MRVASLDLGSNTSLLLVAEVEDGKVQTVLHDETRITRMGQGVHAEKRLHPEALVRLEACFHDYQKRIQELNCEKIVAVATSAARDVENGAALLRLGQKYGIPIHIISGEQEARLTFRGAICDRPGSDGDGIAVIDVGGGSTEVITGQDGRTNGVSVDVGSVRLTELFITAHPVPPDEQMRLRRYCEEAFAKASIPRAAIQEVVAVAGTPTTLAAVDQRQEFSDRRVNGYHLTLGQIENWVEKMAAMSVEQREVLPGMQPKRADVIVAGGIILAAAIRALGGNEVTVSTRGVRYGVALAWQEF